MSVTEIVLLCIGGVFFAVSFFIPDKKKEKEEDHKEEIRNLINREVENAKSRIDDMVEETVNYSVEKTERALEKLSNEKIMEVSDYSDSVLQKINDNHNEAVFLYDMLNDKDEKIKTAGEEIKVSKEELETVKNEILKKVEDEKTEAPGEKEEPKVFTPFKPEIIPADSKNIIASVPEEKKPANKRNTSAKTKEKSQKKTSEILNDGKKNSNELIRKLHEEGKTNMQIAKELNLGVGEVKLVLDLYSVKRADK